jgi:hypothetical protein
MSAKPVEWLTGLYPALQRLQAAERHAGVSLQQPALNGPAGPLLFGETLR